MNKHEKRAIAAYGRAALDYSNSKEGRYTLPVNRYLADIVKVPAGGRLLDIACGDGRLLHMLSRTRTFEGYGVDISGGMVRAAQKALPGMVFHQAPCDHLPFEDNFFDALTVCCSFHHFPDISAFAREASRIMKPGGQLYIADVYYPSWLRVLLNPLIRFHPSGDVKIYAPSEINRLLKNHGFDLGEAELRNGFQIHTAQKRR